MTEFADAERQVQLGLGLFTCIAWLWLSEAIHISATALMVPLLASLLGIFEVREAFQGFSHPIIFLFMGGFALAAALQKYELDRIFAVRIMTASRGVPLIALLLLFLTTAMLSMWISNTAAVAMMLPLAIGLISSENPKENPRLYLFVLLGLAYSGNIGGIATLIGSPPNAIAASAVDLNFADWLKFGIPAFVLLFPIMIVILYLYVRPDIQHGLRIDKTTLAPDRRRLLAGLVFLATAAGWIFSGPLAAIAGVTESFDSIVAVTAIILMIVIRILSFAEFVEHTNWAVLILFGGGLTLSAALQSSGASAWMADNIIEILPAGNQWLVYLLICIFVIFLTELVSNTASAALLVPLFFTVGLEFGYPAEVMVIMIAVCASCAFMLPVATPPNALVFSSGLVPQRKMMTAGLILNLSFALLLSSLFLLVF